MFTRKRKRSLMLVGMIGVSILIFSLTAASSVASAHIRRHRKWWHPRHYPYHMGFYISISPPPPRYIYVPSPEPIYTPSVSSTVVTVRNATNWYVLVNINGMELDLCPGCQETVSWIYTGKGHAAEARAYLDPSHQKLAGTYQGNLIGYEIPWILNFDYGSFG